VGDLVLLSTKDLKWQMEGRRTEKLMERFVGPYKVKRVVSTNVVELELPRTVRIYSVCNDKSSWGNGLITLNVMREQRELDGVSW